MTEHVFWWATWAAGTARIVTADGLDPAVRGVAVVVVALWRLRSLRQRAVDA